MEDGNFSRGADLITAEGSVVLLGNIDGEIETILRTSNLFYPMPEAMDAAFYDRIHCYLPGWEFEKTRDEYYTNHFGLVSDYFAEVMRGLRKESYADLSQDEIRKPHARRSPAWSRSCILTVW
jgi:ATP-dependent Lon protease